jgi:hypothetical protein
MLQESLPEMLAIARYSVMARKPNVGGCYGFPAAILLLCVADAIGSYTYDTSNIEKHFDILNDPDFYGLGLKKPMIKAVYNKYRNLLTHNVALAPNASLAIGASDTLPFEDRGGVLVINLVPFLAVTDRAVNRFLKRPEIVTKSRLAHTIMKK